MKNDFDSWINAELAEGRYLIDEFIGRGGMGVVFRARDRKLEQDVAVKAVNPSLIGEGDFSTRFQQEIRSLVNAEHPHVVKIVDVGVHDDVPWLVMQYLSGGSLASRHPSNADGQRSPAPPNHLRNWLPQIAAALDSIHEKGYIHRDVKPANILFDGEGNACLGDFGVVKVIADGPSDSQPTQAGTLGYMAPELLKGKPIDRRSDQFSLAVTVYEMLTGRKPFGAQTGTVLQTFVPPHRIDEGIPPALSDVVMKALSEEPNRRFPDCQAFCDAVTAALDSPVAQIQRPGVNIRAISLLIGGIVLASAVVFLLFHLFGQSSEDRPANPNDKAIGGRQRDKDPPQTPPERFATLVEKEQSPTNLLEAILVDKPRIERRGNSSRVTFFATTRPDFKKWKSLRDRLRQQLEILSTRESGPKFIEFKTTDFANSSGTRALTPSAVNDMRQISLNDRNSVYWVIILRTQIREPETRPFESNWVAYPVSKAIHEMLFKRSQSLFAIRAKVVDKSGTTVGEKVVGLQTVNGKRLLWRRMGVMEAKYWHGVHMYWLSPAFWMDKFYRMRLSPVEIHVDVDSDKLTPNYRVELKIEEVPFNSRTN